MINLFGARGIIILMKQIWLVNLDIFKDNDEDLSKTIAKIKTPENRGWRFYHRLLSNLMTRYTLTLFYVELMLQQAINAAMSQHYF